MIRLNLTTKKHPPNNSTQLLMFEISKNKYFDYSMTIAIFSCTFLMTLHYYKMDETYEFYLDIMSKLLTFVFNIEAVIKILAYERAYFSS